MTRSPIFCEHANEVPTGPCPCDRECYCKEHTCKGRVSVADVPVMRYQLTDEEIWLQMWKALAMGGVSSTYRSKSSDAGLVDFKKRFR